MKTRVIMALMVLMLLGACGIFDSGDSNEQSSGNEKNNEETSETFSRKNALEHLGKAKENIEDAKNKLGEIKILKGGAESKTVKSVLEILNSAKKLLGSSQEDKDSALFQLNELKKIVESAKESSDKENAKNKIADASGKIEEASLEIKKATDQLAAFDTENSLRIIPDTNGNKNTQKDKPNGKNDNVAKQVGRGRDEISVNSANANESQPEGQQQNPQTTSRQGSDSAKKQIDIEEKITKAKTALGNAITAVNSANSSIGKLSPPKVEGNGLLDWIVFALKVAAPLFGLALLIGGLVWFTKHENNKTQERLGEEIGVLKQRQDRKLKEIKTELDALTDNYSKLINSSAELKQRFIDVQRLQAQQQTASQPAYSNDHVQQQRKPDGPAFPLMSEDYMQWVKRLQWQSAVVRTDFQNDILVADNNGNGELVLVRDLRDQKEYAIPHVTSFQTKQDFFTYYGKYYDCDKPSAGDILLLSPAVVQKVAGGWRVIQKGRLEVR